MNDNYLWDRSGEPDPEIQELEEILGTLRYQPRPLEIPAELRIARKRNFFPLAIAAAIALFVIGAGLWFQFSRSQSAPAIQANRGSEVAPPRNQTPVESPKQLITSNEPGQVTPPRHQPKKVQLASNRHRENRVESRRPELTPQELAEKEQVLTALRLVSAKLNLAQRKVHSLPQRNIFRNQNKIG